MKWTWEIKFCVVLKKLIKYKNLKLVRINKYIKNLDHKKLQDRKIKIKLKK